MNLNQKFEKYAETKVRYLLDSESVRKEKRYKLGEWFHGEYRNKLKKAAGRLEHGADNLDPHEKHTPKPTII